MGVDVPRGDAETLTAGATTTEQELDGRGDLDSLVHRTTVASEPVPVLAQQTDRDGLGRVDQLTESVGGAPSTVTSYVYDDAGRLTGVTGGVGANETYAYDASGGLVSRGSGVLSTWIQADGHGRPTSAADGSAWEWSDDGELVEATPAGGGTATQFAYDGFGRLTQVDLPGGSVGRYRYDALGRRTAVTLDGSLVRRFVYGGSEFPQARVDADGDVLERYVYATGAHVPDVIVRRDGTRLRLVTDALGSVRAVVDIDTGQVLQQLAYTAYGTKTQDTDPGLQPFGFKGALTDPVAEGAGLVWMGVRAYQPTMARFTTPDPVGLKAGWNQHDGLGSDPVNRIDPDGRFAFAIPVVIGGAIAIGAVVQAVAEVAAAIALAYAIHEMINACEGGEPSDIGDGPADDFIPQEARDKIPVEWGTGETNRDGKGTRWRDPDNSNNGVRIDRGNPDATWESQREDHVRVDRDGRVIGRDGEPLPSARGENGFDAHIPLKDWLKWREWSQP